MGELESMLPLRPLRNSTVKIIICPESRLGTSVKRLEWLQNKLLFPLFYIEILSSTRSSPLFSVAKGNKQLAAVQILQHCFGEGDYKQIVSRSTLVRLSEMSQLFCRLLCVHFLSVIHINYHHKTNVFAILVTVTVVDF